MRKVIWLTTFVIGAPAIIVWSLFLLTFSTNSKSPELTVHASNLSLPSAQVLSAQSMALSEVTSQVTSADARPLILEKYLSDRNSELAPFSKLIVDTADKYELDFRLLVAIARQESSLCKIVPVNSYNCWGFGIYGDKVTRFENYPQAIETISKTLKIHYIDKGLKTPEQIMAKYTPPSVEIGGPWAKAVNQFFLELE